MDYTLTLQLVFKITVMSLLFPVELVWYVLVNILRGCDILDYIMHTKQKFVTVNYCHFLWLNETFKQQIQFLYDIQVKFYVLLPWIFFSTLRLAPCTSVSPLATRLNTILIPFFSEPSEICEYNANSFLVKTVGNMWILSYFVSSQKNRSSFNLYRTILFIFCSIFHTE